MREIESPPLPLLCRGLVEVIFFLVEEGRINLRNRICSFLFVGLFLEGGVGGGGLSGGGGGVSGGGIFLLFLFFCVVIVFFLFFFFIQLRIFSARQQPQVCPDCEAPLSQETSRPLAEVGFQLSILVGPFFRRRRLYGEWHRGLVTLESQSGASLAVYQPPLHPGAPLFPPPTARGASSRIHSFPPRRRSQVLPPFFALSSAPVSTHLPLFSLVAQPSLRAKALSQLQACPAFSRLSVVAHEAAFFLFLRRGQLPLP